MTPEIFSTQALHPPDQFEAWREWYLSVFEVIRKDEMDDPFLGEIRLWNFGGLAMSRTVAPSIQILRTKGHLRRDPVDHWVISYCARGAHLAKTADTANSKYSRERLTSGLSDRNSCTSGRMSSGCSF